MNLGPRRAARLGLGVAVAALGLLAWAQRERPSSVVVDDDVEGALAAQFELERSAWRAREVQLTQQVTELEAALASEQELRYAREREWLEFTQLVGSLDRADAPPIPEFLAPSSTTDPGSRSGPEAGSGRASPDDQSAEDAAATRAAAAKLALDVRARAMKASLGALLTAEQVHSLDFLELGRPHSFEGRGVVGPVVARIVDDRGRLIGGLFAERLWIEVSRAARCVTLVLEDGYETRGGVRQAFEPETRARRSTSALDMVAPEAADPAPAEGDALASDDEVRSVRRVFLQTVDPGPWLEALPEIIDEATSVAPPDDGVYDLTALRVELNELLRKAGTAAGEGWRMRALGGVQRGVLRDVQLVEHAIDGTVTRRLFADRMEVHRSGRGIELVLEKGSQERNGRLAPFLEGRYRVALPHARAEDWVEAGIPGAARTR